MSVRVDGKLLMEILEETPASHNIMLMGKHGIGKSQILDEYYSSKGFKVVTLFLGQMSDPGDLIGIPCKNEKSGHTDFMPPYWFPIDDTPVVLFLDELNRARPEVLQTIMDLALNRKLAGRSLPKGSRIISAVNNGDEYQLTDLDPALVSRFNVYEFIPSVQDWLLWASKNGIDERIISYITENPKALDNQVSMDDLDNLEKTPDRRGWQRVSDIISGKPELKISHKSMIAGIIGSIGANRFYEYLNSKRMLSGKDLLLGDFKENSKKLKDYDTPQFAIINNEVFVFLEGGQYEESQKALVASNLNAYFDFLQEKNLREAMAHFTNMFSGNMYPNALVLIISECAELYSKLMKFITELK